MSSSRIRYVVLFGPPGSGKGTQAKILSEQMPHCRHISTGDLFRKEISSSSSLGKKIEGILKSGALVSDDVTCQVFKSQLHLLLPKQGEQMLFILDGFPRTAYQASFLLDLVKNDPFCGDVMTIELKVSEDLLVERLSHRLVNPKTGKVYHSLYNPPKKPGVCDVDGTLLVQRDDDKAETVKKRFALYESQKDSVLEVFKAAKVKVSELSGVGEMLQISEGIKKVLNKS